MERTKTGSLDITKDVFKETAKNFLMGIPAFRRLRLKRARTTATVLEDTDAYLKRYAFYALDFMREYLGDLDGKAVCEIGAGDFLTSGFSILAGGATFYSSIDRFPGDYRSAEAKRWYREIEANWSRFYPEIPWREDLRAADFPEKYDDLLELIAQPLEVAESREKFDIICSFQTGEHISDINAYAEIHRKILKPGGVGLHRIDFGPHDCWIHYRDPLTFLRVSDAAWHRSGSNRGTPNRFRHHEFMNAFAQAGLKIEVLKTELFTDDQIEFSELGERFRKMPRESILVGTGIYRLTNI